MKCQRCTEQESVLRIYRSKDSQTGLHICSQCADDLDISLESRAIPLRIDDILDSLLEIQQPEPCSSCGTELEAVLRLGVLGCSACLDSFGQELAERLLDRKQREQHAVNIKPYHRGPLPPSLAGLRELLNGTEPAADVSIQNETQNLVTDTVTDTDTDTDADLGAESASAFDIVISSHILLARSFSGRLSDTLDSEIDSLSLDTYEQRILDLPMPRSESNLATDSALCNFTDTKLRDDIPQRRILREGREFLLGGQENLRCALSGFGFCITEIARQSESIAALLDSHFGFEARIDFGYVTHSAALLGAGISVSVQLHLWALDSLGIMQAVLSECEHGQFSVQQLPGSRVILKPANCFGKKLDEMTEFLEAAVLALVHYERTARHDILQHRHDEWKFMLETRIQDLCAKEPHIAEPDMHELVSDILPAVHAGFWPEISSLDLVRAWLVSDTEGWNAVRCVIASATAERSKEE